MTRTPYEKNGECGRQCRNRKFLDEFRKCVKGVVIKWNEDECAGLGRETTGRQKIRNVGFKEEKKK